MVGAVAVGGAGQFVEGRDQGVIGAERDYSAHFLINFVFDVYGVYSENECIRKLSASNRPAVSSVEKPLSISGLNEEPAPSGAGGRTAWDYQAWLKWKPCLGEKRVLTSL